MLDSFRNTRVIALSGVIAALYIAVTAVIAPIAYGPIQLRLSEVLVLMAFINPIYGYAVSIGVFISNLFGPIGWLDAIVGTSSTVLAVVLISKTPSLLVATIWPTITAALFVGPMLNHVYGLPLVPIIISVGIGQFIVLTCIGYPLFKMILKNNAVYSILKAEK